MQIVILLSNCKLTINSCNILIVSTSNALKGSSNKRILGSLNRDKAITSFLRSPPERSLALISFKLSSSSFEIK